jgi:hypothetical protein
MHPRTGSRRHADNLPEQSLDLRVILGPTEEDGSVTLTIKLTKSAGLAALRGLLAPCTKSPVSESILRVQRDGEREPRREPSLPAGMTAWVSAQDVARAMTCSSSKAHEYLRAASGRPRGTGQLLRVPVDVWEVWARANLIDGRRDVRARPTCDDRPRWTTDGSLIGSFRKPKRRKLGPDSEVTSKLPLLRTLKYVKT